MSWCSANTGDQPSHQDSQVSLCIHSLPRGAPFCLNVKKPWKNIHRHKDSIWRGRRDVQELLLWFLFWKEPGAWLKAQQLAFQRPQRGPDLSTKYSERVKKKGHRGVTSFFLYAKKTPWCDGFYKVIGKGPLKRWGGWQYHRRIHWPCVLFLGLYRTQEQLHRDTQWHSTWAFITPRRVIDVPGVPGVTFLSGGLNKPMTAGWELHRFSFPCSNAHRAETSWSIW